MRAVCEACERPQPIDWQPGHLCVHCGKSVREEARCYWCARFTPDGNYCRRCGAASIASSFYGAARMLKDAGSDRFTIPKMLRELDPAQVETFQSIYTRHLAVAMRHIEDLRLLERYLYQRHWSIALADELIPQLPWPDEKLDQLTLPPLPPADDLTLVRMIGETSPFPQTRALAQLARLRLDDLSQLNDAVTVHYSSDKLLRAEALLHLTDWRVLYASEHCNDRYQTISELRQSPVEDEAAIRLAIYGVCGETPQIAPRPSNEDAAFLASIARGDIGALEAALSAPNRLKRFVAARQLILRKHFSAVGEVLAGEAPERQLRLLEDIQNTKTAAPDLHSCLFQIVERTPDSHVRDRAISVLARGASHQEAMRLLNMAPADSDVIHALFLAPLAPETLEEIGTLLVIENRISINQFGWDTVAKVGRMPERFVERAYPLAAPRARAELVLFLEKQIGYRSGDSPAMDRFLVRLSLSDEPLDVLDAAWGALHRLGYGAKFGSPEPFELNEANVLRYFTLPEFLERLTALLNNRPAMDAHLISDRLARFLTYPSEDFLAAIFPYREELALLRDAADRIASDETARSQIRDAVRQLTVKLTPVYSPLPAHPEQPVHSHSAADPEPHSPEPAAETPAIPER